jgi:hypothetical protein
MLTVAALPQALPAQLRRQPLAARRAGCAAALPSRLLRCCVAAALRLEPVGDGSCDHLPPTERGACVTPGAVVLPGPGSSIVLGSALLRVATVSEQHVRLEVTHAGEVFVTDLDSLNGTTLGGCAAARWGLTNRLPVMRSSR